jgi:hypothetical protein
LKDWEVKKGMPLYLITFKHDKAGIPTGLLGLHDYRTKNVQEDIAAKKLEKI